MSTLIKVILGLGLSLGISALAHAGEERYLTEMPSSPVKVGIIKKSKKPGFSCQYVKEGEKGNPNVVKGSKTFWFTDVPESQDAADDLLAEGKRAVRCKLMIYDKSKHRMVTADLGDES